MEIASRKTGGTDVEDKPARYAALGISEYWRFGETGDFHGSKLAGDRLVDGQYEPINIEEIGDGILQGYSTVLGLFIQWEHGHLRWHDQETGQEIPAFEGERSRANAAEEGRFAAEARVRELESELARRGEQTQSGDPTATGR